MDGVALGDDGVARRDRRRKISTGGAGKRERKVVRSEHDDGADRSETRSDVELRVDRRQGPAALDGSGGRLAQLVDGARQLDVAQPWRDRQAALDVREL